MNIVNTIIQNLITSNPQYKQVMDMVSQYGDAKTAFYEEAKKRGVNPQDILNQVSSYFNK